MNNDELVVYLPYIKDLVIASVPSIFAFVLYRYQLAKDLKKENKKRELEILKERMEKFYNPFYVKYFKCEIPMTIDENKINNIVDLANIFTDTHLFFSTHLYLMGKKSQTILVKLYKISYKMNEISKKVSVDEDYSPQRFLKSVELRTLITDFKKTYDLLLQSIQKEYEEICEKLGY